jgi:hypothetical protein
VRNSGFVVFNFLSGLPKSEFKGMHTILNCCGLVFRSNKHLDLSKALKYSHVKYKSAKTNEGDS